MLNIVFSGEGIEYFPPKYTSNDKLSSVIDSGHDNEEYSNILTDDDLDNSITIVYCGPDIDIVVNEKEKISISELDKSQFVVAPYQIYKEVEDKVGYYRGRSIGEVELTFVWNNEDYTSFNRSKLKIYAHRVTFKDISGDKWTHLYFNKIVYDEKEADEIYDEYFNDTGNFTATFVV